jgi:hypothetical protein
MPYTKHGALMLGNVLKSGCAVEASFRVIARNAFKQQRNENEAAGAGTQSVIHPRQAIAGLIDAIRQLMKQPVNISRPIGFTANIKGSRK